MRFAYHSYSSILIALGVWLSLLPLTALISADAFVGTVPLLLATSAVVGSGLALLHSPRPLTLVVQAVALGGVLIFLGMMLAPAGNPMATLPQLTADGIAAVRESAPPLASSPGVSWLVLILAAVLTLVLEILVCGLEQPAWAIAPIALAYTMSALIVRDTLSPILVLPVVAAYLIVLLGSSGVGAVTGRASRVGAFHASMAGAGVAVTAIALAVSFIVAPLIPMGDKQLWNSDGPDGPIQLGDPTVQLNQDLLRPDDSPVLTYRSSDGEPTYLRTVALTNVTADGARLTPMQLSRFGLGGSYNYSGTPVSLEIQMADVASDYLPVPFAVKSFDAEGTWSFDPDTLSIVAAGEDRVNQTRNLRYTVEAQLPEPSREQIQAAEAGSGLDPILQAVPEGLDSRVEDLTREVVAGASTAGEKALAIQSYLRSDTFTYSLSAPRSSGSSALNTFLLSDHWGYCIHFAAAMIAMARIESIPARMAIGFAPGERQEDGSYQVTSHDAHAWPELYLDGLGWVPFEPTPAFAGSSQYTDPAESNQSSSASASASPTSAPPTTPTEEPSTPSAEPSVEPAPDASGGPDMRLVMLGLLVLALIAAPALTRSAQRHLRLRPRGSSESADGAWREVRATLTDYGQVWPPGSPGPSARAMAKDIGGEAANTLLIIGRAVEVSRFGRPSGDAASLAEQVRTLRRQIAAEASRGQRVRAIVLPRSLFPVPHGRHVDVGALRD